MKFYAHTFGENKEDWQLLFDHLTQTAELAYKFGKDSGLSEIAYLTGMLHDIGKYSYAFQKRLLGCSGHVDHSTAGGREICDFTRNDKLKAIIGNLIAYCVVGHHSGLPDYGSSVDLDTEGTLKARLKKNLEEYSVYQKEINLDKIKFPEFKPLRPSTKTGGFTISFFTRMLFSCLVDADYQDTENFMTRGEKKRGGFDEIPWYQEQFNRYLEKFENPTNPINEKRTEILQTCIKKANYRPGLFTLTVPTGGGKTFASMAFALNHAYLHQLSRIIYVIPYTSIIEQNASAFKEVLGENNVLEHHSNFDWKPKNLKSDPNFSDDQSNNAFEKVKLSAENWDIPVVVTTNVQFFESLYTNRSRGCRKIHNIAKSVIIFDEAQMLPLDYLKPCLFAISELISNYGSSAIFCTATQPSIERFMPGKVNFQELAPNPQELYQFFKRVRVKSIGKISDSKLMEKINSEDQVLCIVNTRKHAKGLFDMLLDEDRFHLSTLMCPNHRKKTIQEIKDRLQKSNPCKVISTQIMEAGIDVDFPVGYRALSGLDSIIQAAGRVNREGKRKEGIMHVFEVDSEFVKKTPAYIQQGAVLAKKILRNFSDDPISLQAIYAYYNELYQLQSEKAFDMKEIINCFERGIPEFDFKTAADRFNLIENSTVSVIIPYDEYAENLIHQLRFTEFPKSIIRKLQSYTVNIYEREFEALQSLGLIDTYLDFYSVLNSMDYYNKKTGLIIPDGISGDAIFL